jgi:predicted ArsR family transcriptional regulator
MSDRPSPPESPDPSGPPDAGAGAGDPGGDRLAAIASLGEPTRRAVYDHLVADGGWVSRDQAADAVGLGRGTAAHHLDRLAAGGLVEVDFQRLTGRTGPGAGRPAKLYRRARRDFDVSLPPRDYELAGTLLARAADRASTEGIDVTLALDEAARAEGQRLAERVRARLRTAPAAGGTAGRRRVVLNVLEEHGFEPRPRDDGTIALTNCPFHRLARQHTQLICGMNLGLLDAAIAAVGETGLDARLEPEDGRCCVVLGPSG